MDIDFENLALAQQVLDRQRRHAEAASDHLERYARLDAAEMGLILQLLHPINEAIVDGGQQVLGLSAQVYGAAAGRMGETRSVYLDAETTAAAAAERAAAAFGVDLPTFRPPVEPLLGAAAQGAPERYGEPDGDLFTQAFWDGYSAAGWVDGAVGQVVGRAVDVSGATRQVTEQVAAQEFLVTPHADDPEIESIRWKAGLVLGGVDWVFEQLFGYSLLEEVSKPFSGNWVRMREASMAWTHVGDTVAAVATNTTGLVPPMATWTGRGSEAFLVASSAVGMAHESLSSVPGTVAGMLKGLVLLSKEIAKLIMSLLRRISERLMRMAVEAAVPVAGWVAAGVEAAVMVQEIVDDVLTVYKWINMAYDFVSGMVQGQTAVLDARMRMADLAEGLARATAARA